MENNVDIMDARPMPKLCIHCAKETKDLGVRVGFEDELFLCSPCLAFMIRKLSTITKRKKKREVLEQTIQ